MYKVVFILLPFFKWYPLKTVTGWFQSIDAGILGIHCAFLVIVMDFQR